MSGIKENFTLAEGPSKPENQPNNADSATRRSFDPSNKSSGDDNNIPQQLGELRELIDKHSEIISLLRKGFKIPAGISEDASTLTNSVLEGWKRLYPTPRLDRDTAEGLLLKMLPCGTQFMGLDVTEMSSPENDFAESSAHQKERSQKRLKMVTDMLNTWVEDLNGQRPFPRSYSNEAAWKPVILFHGKSVKGPDDCIWPRNWNFILKRKQHAPHVWAFFIVAPPGGDEDNDTFQVQDILRPDDYPRYSPDDEVCGTALYFVKLQKKPQAYTCLSRFRHTGGGIAHIPIHGVIWVTLFQKSISMEDLVAFVSMSSESLEPTTDDLMVFNRHFGPWVGHWGLIGVTNYRPSDIQAVGRDFKMGLYSYYMKSFRFAGFHATKVATKEEDKKNGTSSDRRSSVSGIQFEREFLSIEDAPGRQIRLLEHRYSSNLAFSPHCDPIGNFRLVSITDTLGDQFYSTQNPIGQYAWDKSGIRPVGMLTGIAAFQVQLYLNIHSWAFDWEATLNKLSGVVSVTPSSIEDEEELDQLMYDPELKKTKTYFKVLQILRMFSDIIKVADTSFERFSTRCNELSAASWGRSFQKEHIVLDHNWLIITSFHKEKSKQLLFQIAAMKEEVESLRDGVSSHRDWEKEEAKIQQLFNAQSIKEAQKSRELNKIMMVFTIVTILFLPPTFVATFFGVEVFHAASDVQTRKIFWTVFSIVTVTTLVTSLGAILGLLTPASWTRLRSAMPKLSGSSDNLLAEQEEPEKTQDTWRQLSSFLRRDRKGARTSEQDSTLA